MKKRILTLLLCAALFVTLLAACSNGAAVLTVNGEPVENGYYGFYVHWQRDYVKELLKNTGYDIGSCMDQAYTSTQTVRQYIESTAKERCLSYLVVTRQFDELGLKLTDEQKAEIEKSYSDEWIKTYGEAGMNNILKKLGLSKDEFLSLLSVQIKSDALIEYFYGENGQMPITEQDKKDYFEKNYIRFRYIVLSKKDDNENDLPAEEIARKEALAQEILKSDLPFADLIKAYSEDYQKITDDMTEEEKATAESTNQKSVTDGLMCDLDGVFNTSLYSIYGYKVEDDIVKKVQSLDVGQVDMVDMGGAIWIVEKCDLNEKEDYYKSRETTIYSSLYGEDFSMKYTRWLSEMDYAFSEEGLKAYNPENFSDMFSKVYDLDDSTIA